MLKPAAPVAAGKSAGPETTLSATEAARAAIRHLAERKLLPTPSNYRGAWIEVGGPSAGADAELVAQSAVRLLMNRGELGEGIHAQLSAAVRDQRWSDALSVLVQLTKQPTRGQWGDLLATLVTAAGRSGRDWPSARRIDAIAERARENDGNDAALKAAFELLMVQWRADVPVAQPAPEPADTAAGLPDATAPIDDAALLATQRDGARLRKVNAELVEIVLALCTSFDAVTEPGSWIAGQVDTVRGAVTEGADRRTLAAARSLLQQALVTQQSISRSRRDAITALRDLLPHLVQQMTHLGTHTQDFSDTLDTHLQAISEADSLEGIAERVRGLIADSRAMQETMDEARRDLDESSDRAHALESEVERLERELAQASERLLTDHLTRAANRAGLDRAFERAMGVLRDTGDPLAIALLDVDDFKKVNDALGHQAGDGALKHLAQLLQGKVRAGDTVARYGGEEFVLLLPGMTDVQARELLVRVQRELTREVYLFESRQIFITFSAGTTRVDPQDSLESALGRADDAMYQAKNAGKNCVSIA